MGDITPIFLFKVDNTVSISLGAFSPAIFMNPSVMAAAAPFPPLVINSAIFTIHFGGMALNINFNGSAITEPTTGIMAITDKIPSNFLFLKK